MPKSAKSNLETINTRDELAKIAKVSHDTYNKAKKIVDLEEKAYKGGSVRCELYFIDVIFYSIFYTYPFIRKKCIIILLIILF